MSEYNFEQGGSGGFRVTHAVQIRDLLTNMDHVVTVNVIECDMDVETVTWQCIMAHQIRC